MLLALGVILLCAGRGRKGYAPRGKGYAPEERGWTSLFNGKDLRGWDSYLKEPIGLNRDPHHVFTVVKDGNENVIRISGEDVGAITRR